jgi:WD40 repeat protein/serine/threonine protein kinase
MAIFSEALELNSTEERAAYLDRVCGPDGALRGRVEDLLRAHVEGDDFLEVPAPVPTVDPTPGGAPAPDERGTVIGPYKLLQQIGEGGMGVVYMAEQQAPVRRKVALKVIKPGMDSAQVIARFEAERQALAMMEHQNIAKVLDAGTTDGGRPYFVMELVHGVLITKYCDDHQLTPRQRLELFVPVCHAVQHAHQKGVIHRDLKPSNILVTMYDDQPVPKVIDFGVAKAVEQRLTEKSLFTQFGTMVGTFEYMSPEQAELNAFGVDTRSDIYSLGVLLYELLTGTTPLERQRLGEAAYGEIVRLIKEEEPPPPSTRLSSSGAELAGISRQRGSEPGQLAKLVRGELDWIVMRCLEKNRARRYEAASGLARDIERYLHDEPVEACPPTAGYRLRKLARKHQKLLVTAAAFVALLLLGVAASAWQAVRATTAEAQANANATQAQEKAHEATAQRDLAQKQRDEVRALNDKLLATNEKLQATQAELRSTLYAAHMNLAQHTWETGSIGQVRELLEQHRPKAGETDLRGFEWHYLDRLCHPEILTLKAHTPVVRSMVYSPDGKRLASAGGGVDITREVKVWDAQTGQVLLSLWGADRPAFSPDGKRLATSGGIFDATKRAYNAGRVKVWDAQTGQELLSLQGLTDMVRSMAFSPDGTRLAIGDNKTTRIWDAQTGQELLSLKGHTSRVTSVAYSPDGKRLASGGGIWDDTKRAYVAGEVKVWDAQTGQELLSLKGHTWGLESVAFSPDGKRLASGTQQLLGEPRPGEVKVWDAQTGQELLSLKGHLGQINSVGFSPDGKRLASAGRDRIVRVWDAQTGQELLTYKGHTGMIWSVAFSPDGTRLASGALDGTIKVWDATISPEARTFRRLAGGVYNLVFSPDGKRLAGYSGTGTSDNAVKVCDAQTGQELLSLKGGSGRAAFSPDGKRLASAAEDKTVKVWDAQTGQELLTCKGHTDQVGSVAFSPDGKRLASTARGGEVKVWDAQTCQELLSLQRGGRAEAFGRTVAFSPDGKRLASVAEGQVQQGTIVPGEVRIWDAQTGQELLTWKVNHGAGGSASLAFSPDGKRLATSSQPPNVAGPMGSGEVKVWDVHTGRELLTLQRHPAQISSVAFSPDGKRLASAAVLDGTVKVWDAQSGQEVLNLKVGGHVSSLAFSPDGHWLASDPNGTVMIWDATPLPAKDKAP